MKDLVEYIVKALVDKKDEVEISLTQENNAFVINVKIHESDLGKVIGKNGRIATSIRNIVKSLSSKEKVKYIVKIGEKEWLILFLLEKLLSHKE